MRVHVSGPAQQGGEMDPVGGRVLAAGEVGGLSGFCCCFPITNTQCVLCPSFQRSSSILGVVFCIIFHFEIIFKPSLITSQCVLVFSEKISDLYMSSI